VDKGLPREGAYKIVQRNAMRSWDQGEDFRDLLKADPDAQTHLSPEEMERIFDYSYYTRYIDDTFQRVGLVWTGVSA
jgi:adenylosuccinate lyase